MKTTTRIFGTEDVKRAAEILGFDRMMDHLIDRLQAAFENYDPATTEVPVRGGFSYDEPTPGLVEWMPVIAYGRYALMKLVSYHPSNPEKTGLPTILSSFSLIDTSNGHLVAIADGTFLTALRTGAASALAARALADPESRTLGLVGCGAQAVTQLHALTRVLPIDLVLLWDSDPAARKSFADRVGSLLPATTRLRESPLELTVPNADVLCTATSIAVGAGPLFSDCPTKDSLHVNAVGSDFPGKFEIPRSLLLQSTVIPDFAEQAIAEGECQQLAPDQVGPELHEILRGGSSDKLRRQRTVFDSTGWALEDLVAMESLLEWSEALSLGHDVQLESVPADPKNPYCFARDLAETASQ